MARFGTFLDRFRRLVAPPGRPSEAIGVPASGADLESELGPVLAELAGIDAEASRIEDDARRRAQEISEHGQREAAAMVEDARGRADAVRVRAAAERTAQTRQDSQSYRDEASREAGRIRAVREEAVTALVGEVLACVRQAGR